MYIKSIESIANSINELGRVSSFDIISLIISVASCLFAILVPVRIANKQDKISLFEKRLDAYIELKKLVYFCESISKEELKNVDVIETLVISEKINDVIDQFCQYFNCEIVEYYSNNLYDKYILSAIEKNRLVVNTIPFLYGKQLKGKNNLIIEQIDDIYRELAVFMENICNNKKVRTDKLTRNVKKFMDTYDVMLIKSLKM